MSILIEQDSDLALLHRGTRRFLWAGFIATLLIFVFIFMRQGVFRTTSTLGFLTDSALDINKGQSVKIAGFRVGSVDQVTLRPDGQVEVSMAIDSSHLRFVTADAEVVLLKEGLVGSAILEILPGKQKDQLAANNGMLKFSRADGLTAMANSLREAIMPILADVKTITGTLADSRHGLPATMAQLRETTSSLNTLLKTGHQQTGELTQATVSTLKQADQSLVQVEQTLRTVNRSLPELLNKTQHIVDHVEQISANAQTSLPPLLQDSAALTSDVREIITGAKTVWPLKNLVESAPDALMKFDSDPRAEVPRVGR